MTSQSNHSTALSSDPDSPNSEPSSLLSAMPCRAFHAACLRGQAAEREWQLSLDRFKRERPEAAADLETCVFPDDPATHPSVDTLTKLRRALPVGGSGLVE